MSYQNHAWKHRPRSQGGTDPIEFPSSWSGPTWYRPLYFNGTNDRVETQNGSLNSWVCVSDPTQYSTGYITNADDTLTTWSPAEMYIGMNLGPKGSIWGIQLVYDRDPDGGLLNFRWATDDPSDGVPADPRSLTYYSNGESPINMNGSLVTDELNSQQLIRIMGDPGDMLSANSSGIEPDYGFAFGMDAGPGLWWLRISVTDGNSPNGEYKCRLRDLIVVRYADGVALN